MSTAPAGLTIKQAGSAVQIAPSAGTTLAFSGSVAFSSAVTADALNGYATATAAFGVESAKAHGAVGDGTTDDTNAIQRALNTGNAVDLGTGTFLVSATLTITTPGQTVFGHGAKTTIVVPPHSAFDVFHVERPKMQIGAVLLSSFVMNLTNATGGNAISTNNVVQFLAANVTIASPFNGVVHVSPNGGDFADCSIANVRGSYGIYCIQGSGCALQRTTVANAPIGVWFGSPFASSHIMKSHVTGCGRGIVADNGGMFHSIADTTVDAIADYALYYDGITRTTITNSTFQAANGSFLGGEPYMVSGCTFHGGGVAVTGGRAIFGGCAFSVR